MQKYILSLLLLVGFLTPMNSNAQTGIECKGCVLDSNDSKRHIPIDTMSNFCRINGNNGGAIDSAGVANWILMKVMVRNGNGFDSISVKVKSYSCIVQDNNGVKTFNSNTSAISDDIKAAIYPCQNKSLVIFHSIITYNELGEEQEIALGPVYRIQK
ncbi:MAG: hypothetical protein NTW54_13420 [Bacteroidetes bacterium]|nr:hypothetical protein [Bacteroidota bacterium]